MYKPQVTIISTKQMIKAVVNSKMIFTFTFAFMEFGRRFYPKRLTKRYVEGDSNISLWYIKIRIEQVSSIHSCKANRTQDVTFISQDKHKV